MSKTMLAGRQILGHYGSEDGLFAELVRLTELRRLDFNRSISGTLPLAEAAEPSNGLSRRRAIRSVWC